MAKIDIELININKTVQEEENITLKELLTKYYSDSDKDILVAELNNEIVDLTKKVQSSSVVKFLTIENRDAFRAYQNTALFLLLTAIKEHFGKSTDILVKHSIGKNLYLEVRDVVINNNDIEKIEELMKIKVHQNIQIEKYLMGLKTAKDMVENFHLEDKKEVLRYRRGSSVTMYKLDWFYNYFYGALVMDLSLINNFKVMYSEPNIILQLPNAKKNNELLEIRDIPKIAQVFEDSTDWATILEIETVGKLNKKIVNNKFNEVIRLNEELHEKKLSNIADSIKQQNKKLVLIAGPSSSGKTTFAHRLADHLRVNGLKPHIISLDDYYLERSQIPFGEDGKQNFEVVESLDIDMINKDTKRILAGEKVEIPEYNFKTGVKEYHGRIIELKEDDIIIMEGIHGLNDIITKEISKEDKFKVFISALTTLNIDNHNRIATSDTRLIRRLVRDNRARGFNAISTIDMWPKVLEGEVMNIFPYQNEADAVFNSSLIYEISVLKSYVEPLLFSIEPDQPEYKEARRLVKFLENFLVPHDTIIPATSLCREFIGGGIFF